MEVTQQVYTAMKRHEGAAPEPPLHHPGCHADRKELRARHHAVLRCGEAENGVFGGRTRWGGPVSLAWPAPVGGWIP